MEPIRHVYIHIPFCSGKCVYCSFYSTLYDETDGERFLNALEREIGLSTSQYMIRPKTIYIGGGTPSLLPPPQLKRLLRLLATALDLTSLTEWSIEANPGTLSQEKIELLAHYGVNRVSIGAQSMDNDVLSEMARRHSALDTCRTVDRLRDVGFENIGLDLIACLPGVDGAAWQDTLEGVIALSPRHLSIYTLTADIGSKLHTMQQRRQWEPASAEEEQAAIATGESNLSTAGYHRYEISNYAQPGYECAHNTAVWEGADYIGFGPAAASRVQCLRWTNTPDLTAYSSAAANGGKPPRTMEEVSPETDAIERFMFTFRLCDGVDPEAFARRQSPVAQKFLPMWLNQLAALEDDGLIARNDTVWALTPIGRNFADSVAERFLP